MFGATIAVYANSLSNGFHYDDKSMIIQNPAVQDAARLPEHFWSVTIGNQEGTPSYRPLVMATYSLNYWWGGADPEGYHVVNIVLHATASGLVVLLLWHLTQHALAALFGGVVFALHPFQTEAVNYVTARSSLLYSATALGAAWAFVRYRASGRMGWLIGSTIAYTASLLTKEAAVAVPLLLIGYDLIVRRCEWSALRQWIRPHVPFLVLTVAYIVLRRVMMGDLMPAAYHRDVVTVGLTFAAIVAKTLTAQFLPTVLSISHPFGPMRHLTSQALAAVAVFASVLVAVGVCRRRAPLLAYAAAWFPVALLPVAALSLITTLALYQENRGYLSLVGLALVAGPFLAWWWEDRGKGAQWWVLPRRAVVLALFGAMAIAVVAQNRVWRDDVSLWRHALRHAPGNQEAYVNLGAAYQARGEFAAAAEVYRAALERFPTNSYLYNNLGAVYLSVGDRDRAADAFRDAIRLSPLFAMPYFNLGRILQDNGARDEALRTYRRFLELAPGQPGAAPYIPRVRQRLAEIERSDPAHRSQ